MLFNTIIDWMNLIGIVVFAVSGALEASRKQMDIVGFMLIAIVTGIGGGTLRDILLGHTPLTWVAHPEIIFICMFTAIVVYFAAPFFESRFKVLLWADAVGLALFSVTGTEAALAAGASGSVALFMGVISATFGGVTRDIICNEVPLILRREIYATAAAIGAGIYILLEMTDLSRPLVFCGAFVAALAIRSLAIIYHFSLPAYRSKPGRERDGE